MTNRGQPPSYLVIGATGGIGRELCRQLSGRGERVLAAARSAAALEEIAAELNIPAATLESASPQPARIGLANHEAIAAAKAAVAGLTLSAAATYASRGLRVNCVAPGLVRTPLTRRLTANERSAEFSTSLHALKRLGEPKDVASAIAWLLDPDNDWVTGQVLGVDGGLGSVRSA